MKIFSILLFCIFLSQVSFALVSKTVECTAGNLTNLLTPQEKSTVTDLTITGTIDARDFKTMRDSMLVISVIDMSAVTILSYSGDLGTSSITDSYPANEIPRDAFYKTNYKTSLTNIQLPSSVVTIGYSAFYGCSSLTALNIPNSVTTLKYYAFSRCTGITSFSIPSSVTNIESALVFYYCSGDIIVHSENPNYSSDNGVLFNKDKTEIIHCPTSKTGNYDIPATVTKISDNAFENCHYLSSVSIPATVTNIGSFAFYKCYDITSIVLPPNITSIEHSTFGNCYDLTAINIPSFIESIGINAFIGCHNLTTITIPASVKSIGSGAFENLTKLNSLIVESAEPIDLISQINVFKGINKINCTLYVAFMTRELYEMANNWSDFTQITENPGLYIYDQQKYLGSNENREDSLQLYADVTWSVSVDQAWLTVLPTDGENDGMLYFLADVNPDISERAATVTITAPQVPDKTIQIIQYGIPKTIEVASGGLSTALTNDELNTTSNLKITGTIDARDFKTMRDIMPLLSVIDLSNAIITSYTGTAGTASNSGNISYPANSIPEYAFYHPDSTNGKKSLTQVKLPASTTKIGDYSFYKCTSLNDIAIDPLVAAIGNYSFYNCSSLTALILPFSVKSIGNYAFYRCTGLRSVKNDASLISIGNRAFAECNFQTFDFPATLTTIGYNAFMRCNRLLTINIPDKTTNLGYGVFSECSKLDSVTISAPITSIPNSFFYQCRKLTVINLPATITSVGSSSFYNCQSLKKFNFPNSVQIINANAFSYCYSLCTIDFPSSLITIGSSAFNNCALKTLEIPNSVTTIERYAFSSNDSLRSILIANSVKSIGDYAFFNCKNLIAVNIPDSVTTIANSLFSAASSLKSIIIHDSISHIGELAFKNCTKLESITCEKEIPIDLTYSSNVFEGVNKNTCTLYVPQGSKDLYAAASQWKDFTTIIEMPPPFAMPLNCTAGGLAALLPQAVRDTLTYLELTGTIDASDFKTMRDSLPKLAVLDLSMVNVVEYNGTEGTSTETTLYPEQTIPKYAFYTYNVSGKNTLKFVALPVTTKTIETRSFFYCIGLQSVLIPSSISTIEIGAFTGSSGNKIVDSANPIYSSIEGILYDKAQTELIHCPTSKISVSNIPETVASLAYNSFWNCSKLTNVIIPNSVKRIETQAFNYCSNLKSIDIPSSVTFIGSNTFGGCTSLKTVVFPSSVASIGDFIFQKCTGLDSVTIPASVKSIGESAFTGCISLKCIKTYAVVPVDLSTKSNLFYNVDKTSCTLVVPYGSKPAYQLAAQWKDFTNIIEMPDEQIIPDNLELIDEFIGNGESTCYNAQNMITVAGNETIVTLELGSATTFIAGQSIRFLPGFSAQSGSYVDAHITSDGSFCDQVIASSSMLCNSSELKSLETPVSEMLFEETCDEKLVKIYPNPNNGQFTIELTNIENPVEISIVNMLGKSIYSSTLIDTNHFEVDIINHPKGMYMVIINDGIGLTTKKILVK